MYTDRLTDTASQIVMAHRTAVDSDIASAASSYDYTPRVTAADGTAHDDHDEVGAPPQVRTRFFALIGVALVALSGLAGLFVLGWFPHARQEADLLAEADRIASALPRVAVVHPRQSSAVLTAMLPGDVQALEETTVFPRTSGYLKRWLVDIGDEVHEGQLLAEIDTPEVNQELRQARATLGQLRAKLLTAQANLQLADTTLGRYETLLATKAVSRQEYDERRATADTNRSTVEAAKADVTAGEANVQRLVELQSFSKVYAPFAGTITARNVQLGHLVTSGNGTAQSLFRLAKTNPVRVFVNVPQMYAPGVKVGLAAELVVREMRDRKFVGRVTRTARAIDPTTRTMLTEIQVPNPDHALLTGSYVQVKMDVERENPPMLLPAGALVINAGGTSVAVIDATRHVHFQPVEVEGDFGADIGVSGGLDPAALVVANPGERLTEGGAVEITSGPDDSSHAAAPPHGTLGFQL
ncbi:MAG TPA: efflux RND transporter periplasmic adaptor subunit [Pirellulales bacterium]|nr:efflux RND transporter periplasmic adaptor subunit [Pirellulales bacterium]